MAVPRRVVDFVRADGNRRLSRVAGQRRRAIGRFAVVFGTADRQRIMAAVFLPA